MRPEWKTRYWTTLIAAGAVVSCGAVAYAAGFTLLRRRQKIAVSLYFDQKNDGGWWTQAFDEARPEDRDRGRPEEFLFVEKVPERSRARSNRPRSSSSSVATTLSSGTAFGYSDAFKELSEKYPQVAFLNASGTTNGPNLESFYGRTYESQYLCGMIAGGMSKTGKLGFVAAHPIGPVNWTINAYELGAQKINPKATVTVIFTGAWNDPVKERAAAEAMADQGIDVIGQHVDTPTPQIVAQERGIYGTGHHRDLREFAPKATLCSSVWTWDKFLSPEAAKKVAAGKLATKPLRRIPRHQGRRHGYRLLRQRGAKGPRRQGDGRA